MLTIKLLNDQATLNNYFYVESKEYIPGKAFKINLQTLDSELKIRFIPSEDAELTATFQKRDGTELEVEGDLLFGNDDRSTWEIAISDAESLDIVGSNFLVTLDVLGDETDIRQGMSYNSLSKITFDGEC